MRPKRKKRSQNEIGRAILPLWRSERLLRQGAVGFAPTTTVAGEILASDAGVNRTYEDTLRVRPTGFLFEDPVCSISVLPQRQTVCRMMIFESVILSVSEILCKKLFLCFCCPQKERKAQSKRNRSGFPAALVRRKTFTAGGFWLCPNDNGGGGDSCLRCRRKPYI